MSLGDKRAAPHPGKPRRLFRKRIHPPRTPNDLDPTKKSQTANPNRGKEIFLQWRRRKNRMKPSFWYKCQTQPRCKSCSKYYSSWRKGKSFWSRKKRRRRWQAQASPAGGDAFATSNKQQATKKRKTVFFLLILGENGEPTTDFEVPVWGYFVQQEAKKMQFLKTMDVCFPCWEERKEPHWENRKGLRTFFCRAREQQYRCKMSP